MRRNTTTLSFSQVVKTADPDQATLSFSFADYLGKQSVVRVKNKHQVRGVTAMSSVGVVKEAQNGSSLSRFCPLCHCRVES